MLFHFEFSMGGGTIVFPVLIASEYLNRTMMGRHAPGSLPLPQAGSTGDWVPALAQQATKG